MVSEKFGNKSSCAVKLISFKNAEMLQGLSDGETLSGKELEQLKIEEARKNVREVILKRYGREKWKELKSMSLYGANGQQKE